ncbi:HAD family hydrolase [Acidaminobacter sp. JC074]|uniref:HAD family hydrolase n=1 Tax=Acidaminobacter sp. JC074 TaxID=2530199 RepID=UPI001F10ADD0|nr:HAD family hydrolase [Acidaminobacter sp. JC074]MCH4888031.1 HAD family hydrolase [Acidaminobacter sp. JC074]
MKKYKVISFDMFQTLVDVSCQKNNIWESILKEKYTEELCESHAGFMSKYLVNQFHEVKSYDEKFQTLREIFSKCFHEMVEKEKLDFDYKEAVNVFLQAHNEAVWYKDSKAFLRDIHEVYKTCLVTDADMEMLEKHVRAVQFDRVFISERIGSYKANDNGMMFKAVMDYFECGPDEILHIGDSSSDMMGASKLGIDTCWINRHDYVKRFDIEPTYSVKSLDELRQVLLEV